MAKSKKVETGTIRGTGNKRQVWNGRKWVSFRAAFETGILSPDDYGEELESDSYQCAIGCPLEYSITVTLWQVEDFFVLEDESGGYGGVFDNLAEARAAYEEAVEGEEPGVDEDNYE